MFGSGPSTGGRYSRAVEMPDDLDPEDQLTFVIGFVARAEASLLRALLETDLTLGEFASDPSTRSLHPRRSLEDARSGGQVLDGILQKLTGPTYELVRKRGAETIAEAKSALKARNEIVHFDWEQLPSGYWADHVFNDLQSPRSPDSFIDAGETLLELVRRVELLRGDIETAHARARV